MRSRETRASIFAVLVIISTLFCAYAVLYGVKGGNPTASSAYNSYTLQALAWRDGQLHLDHDYPYLELAIYEGDYYVSFPPVPSVVMWVLTYFCGAATPDGLLVKLYAALALFFGYLVVRPQRAEPGKAADSIVCALCVLLCSPLLSITMDGGVWYQAQTLALALITGAAACVRRERWTPACLLYALSVGCRPFNILYAIPFLYYAIERFRKNGTFRQPRALLRSVLPGALCVLAVAGAMCAYNYARFGNILEFGHNYLPEFVRSEHGQFSWFHIAANAHTFLLGLPFSAGESGLSPNMFGFSIWISCPALLLVIVLFVLDLLSKRMTWYKGTLLLSMTVHILLLLSHRTMGGYQFGTRYMIDTLPYVLLYIAESPKTYAPRARYGLIALPFIALSFYGAFIIHT